jgi:hypothetical protein
VESERRSKRGGEYVVGGVRGEEGKQERGVLDKIGFLAQPVCQHKNLVEDHKEEEEERRKEKKEKRVCKNTFSMSIWGCLPPQ